MYEIRQREPTPEERSLLAKKTKVDFASYGCLLPLFGIIAFVLVNIGNSIGSFFNEETATVGRWIGWSLSALLLLYSLYVLFSVERSERKAALKDNESQLIQEIHVSNCRVFGIFLIDNYEPILAFELEQNKILFLQGDWLREAHLYRANGVSGEIGVAEENDDICSQYVNGLPPPFSFPNSEFIVSRLPNSGKVLQIDLAGEYLPPEKTVEALKPEYDFNNSELLEGKLEEIADVLKREHARRVEKQT